MRNGPVSGRVALLPRSAEGKPYLRPDFPPHWPLGGVAEEDRTTEHPRGCKAAPGGRYRVGRFDMVGAGGERQVLVRKGRCSWGEAGACVRTKEERCRVAKFNMAAQAAGLNFAENTFSPTNPKTPNGLQNTPAGYMRKGSSRAPSSGPRGGPGNRCRVGKFRRVVKRRGGPAGN